MDATATATTLLSHASDIYVRAEGSNKSGRPPVYKAVGITLAVASGLFIGVSFVLKKIGLLKANVKYNEEAGEGYGYLRNVWWWTGMTLMIIGEICNFVAYAFVDAILVTPLGALSVVITTILSAIFLKERLSFVGKVGCFCCILGSVTIAMNAPEQSSVDDIQQMQHFVIAPGFLTYAGIVVVGAIFAAVWAGPRYGKRNMFVYICICSFIGGLSVVATQGLGSAILAQFNGEQQFNKWFLYVLFVFVIATLLTEIIYLNKALNIFNAALVTPTYYVIFTSATIVTSAILFRGFKGTGVQIATVVLGFLQICAGVTLLQLSKSSKDVPDAAVFKGDLDQFREVASQEEPESEPKADAIRGTAAIIRRISTPRRNMEAEEARRYFNDRHRDLMTPPLDEEFIEWDGLRRRKSVMSPIVTTTAATARSPSAATTSTAATTDTNTTGAAVSSMTTPLSMNSPHVSRALLNKPLPPLGMSHFPEEEEEEGPQQHHHHHHNYQLPQRQTSRSSSLFTGIRSRASSIFRHGQWKPLDGEESDFAMTDNHNNDGNMRRNDGLLSPFQPRRNRSDMTSRSISWTDGNGGGPSRQFSFHSQSDKSDGGDHMGKKRGVSYDYFHPPRHSLETVTEEERLGLANGDSSVNLSKENDKEDRQSEEQRGRLWSSRLSSTGSSSLKDVTGLVKERYVPPPSPSPPPLPPPPLPVHSSRQFSTSTISVPPPPYEEEDEYHHYEEQQQQPGEYDNEGEDNYVPISRNITPSPPSPPLPPPTDQVYPREQRQPSSPIGSDLGVASLSSSSPPSSLPPPPPPSHSMPVSSSPLPRQGGWRRRTSSLSTNSINSSDHEEDIPSLRGAFV